MPEIKLEPVRPEKAIEYWKTRRPLTDEEKRGLERGARDRALTVAGVEDHRLLSIVHNAIGTALSEGRTLAGFKEDIREVIEKEGLSDWRVENIFRTNLAAAYAAGSWAEIQATKDAFPYLQYKTSGDDRVRPSHAVLHNLVYPVDHEFWERNFPPNGFGCRCGHLQISRWRARKMGLKIETEMPVNKVYKGPDGYPIPVAAPGADRGFVGNVGRDWLAGLAPAELTAAGLTFGAARTVCPAGGEFAGGSGPCGLPLAEIAPKHIWPVKDGDILPAGRSEQFYALEFLKAFGLSSLSESKVIRLPGVGLPLAISKELLTDKATGNLKVKKRGREIYMRLLAQTIQNPFEIWRVPAEMSGKPFQALRLIRLFQAGENAIGGFGVFNLIPGQGWKGATVFTPGKIGVNETVLNYLERQRVGQLLYREK